MKWNPLTGLAGDRGERKAKTILDTPCDIVALANIGCEIQIVNHLQKLGSDRPVLHVVQILDAAYSGIQIA